MQSDELRNILHRLDAEANVANPPATTGRLVVVSRGYRDSDLVNPRVEGGVIVFDLKERTS